MSSKDVADSTRPLTVIGLARIVELAVRNTGLTASQYRAISAIGVGVRSGALLARFLDVPASTITTVIDGLESMGLVIRTRAARDRRRVDLALTADGERALRAANVLADRALVELAGGLGAGARADAFRGLDAWEAAVTMRRRSHWGPAASDSASPAHAP
jgi:DNA-binding MarR family transcriptional regulator